MLKDLFDEDCERYFSKETAEDQKQKLFKSMQQKLRDRLGTDNTVLVWMVKSIQSHLRMWVICSPFTES